jgi:hypothetical protein
LDGIELANGQTTSDNSTPSSSVTGFGYGRPEKKRPGRKRLGKKARKKAQEERKKKAAEQLEMSNIEVEDETEEESS